MSNNLHELSEEVSEESTNLLLTFLQKCGIVCDHIYNLNRLVIPREILINDTVYKTLQEDIKLFRKKFSSSYLTSLQNTATSKQRWPLLNLVRQILRGYYYNLTPKRLCNGYKNKKKMYRRVFIVEKLKKIDGDK